MQLRSGSYLRIREHLGALRIPQCSLLLQRLTVALSGALVKLPGRGTSPPQVHDTVKTLRLHMKLQQTAQSNRINQAGTHMHRANPHAHPHADRYNDMHAGIQDTGHVDG